MTQGLADCRPGPPHAGAGGIVRQVIFALGALGLAAACGGSSRATGPADGSRDLTDASLDAGEALSDSGDATGAESDAGDAGDAGGPSSEGSLATDCTGQAVPPSTLACTGLYADIATKTVASGVRSFQPAAALWSDNAQKARWIALPPGTQIDATNPNEWTFPVGTKLWKEFSKNGKRVETRMFQKVDNGPPAIWVHAAYAWNADESVAMSSGGGDISLDADGGPYHIPTFSECDQCHKGRSDHILGFEQVSLGLQGALGLTLQPWVQPVHWQRIAPGDSSRSLLVQLISNRGTNNPVGAQMPPIASMMVDTADVAKVVQWIDRLPGGSTSDAGAGEGGPD